MRPCSVCGKVVADRGGPRNRAYCSDLCRWEDRPDLVCPGCGNTFRSKDAKAIHCSQRCREASRRAPILEHRRIAALARETARANRLAMIAAARAERYAIRPCRGCGIAFIPTSAPSLAGRQVFHDAECRDRYGRTHGTERDRRRRAKLVQRRFRKLIYERDGSRCYLCRQLIDQAIAFPDPRSPSIDHVMPYSAGGSDDPSNLRAAHLGCNIEKADRLPYWWERVA